MVEAKSAALAADASAACVELAEEAKSDFDTKSAVEDAMSALTLALVAYALKSIVVVATFGHDVLQSPFRQSVCRVVVPIMSVVSAARVISRL